ncbi:hypothetical protein [Paraclostridium sordellii]|uniref:hypothetical protein n=1 Tax=Paraclostridium sordellii TaxID=1505 RepID=UPI0005DE384F|nr:hypothetical protein [Paeniclostridium sordellii]CEO08501.1 Uncharacterised protein [[Clostridium] sordellii] [Paeniclostridium sordellii]CEP87230.1 Uncharacterised protein [[Clostridium] sordellii] [Paeniclostridium sordellii]CEP99089.1 Uncharacterised protein [[Clostridium] sordellii] [Paeniclostridium sordellii]
MGSNELTLNENEKEELKKEVKEELKKELLSEDEKEELKKEVKKELKYDKKISKSFLKSNWVLLVVLIIFDIVLLFLNHQYTTQYLVISIGVILLSVILFLIKDLHLIYVNIYKKENNIKYDITIINMYVKVIKNLVIILGIISILFCFTLYIPIIKDIIKG